MKKRVIAMMLCVVMVLSFLPSAFAVNTAKVFTDVKSSDWFYKNGAIDYVYNHNLFAGISATSFAPGQQMTRAMFVTVLGRLEAVTVNHKEKSRFADVPTKQYYTGYVKWAADNGVVSGVNFVEFRPDQSITREQICAMLIRYCEYAKVEPAAVNAPLTFTDNSQISSYARSAVKACQKAGLVNGEKVTGGYRFRPKGSATRAEVATVLMNFAKKYGALHNWTAGAATVDGCVTTTPYTCDHCAEIKNVITSNHTIQHSGGKAPSCFMPGKAPKIWCTTCDEVFLSGGHLIASKGHIMVDGVCTVCGRELDVYVAAGYAAAMLYTKVALNQSLYLLEVRYANSCKLYGTCAGGAYTFYFKYKIGEKGATQTKLIGIHFDWDSIDYMDSHDANVLAKTGTVLNEQQVMGYANAWLAAAAK